MHPPYPSYAAIEIAATATMRAAKLESIQLREFALATTSEVWDKTLGVLFCYETDIDLIRYSSDGTDEKIKNLFRLELERTMNILPFSKMPEEIHFIFDSHENILKNYKGSCYLRLK
jgi:hypothetical protein